MNAYLIIDAMWGSCGKGLLAGKLAQERRPDVVVCNFGPNAGHTYVDREGRKLMTQQLPTGVVSPGLEWALLGPGAIIDPAILKAELEACGPFFDPEKLVIHENAAVVTAADKSAEQALVAIGSTRKGTAAAATRKIMRVGDPPLRAGDCADLRPFVVSAKGYDTLVANARLVQVESAQGVELSLSRGYFYPYCTGRDVTPEQVLNDCGIPHRFLKDTWAVLRTYPIRVGDEFDKSSGAKVGTSGPVYADMEELTWEKLSKEAGVDLLERTTVTKKVRRVFRPSAEQIRHAFWVIGPARLFINFMNYLDPGTEGRRTTGARFFVANRKCHEYVSWVRQQALITWGVMPASYSLGWGPAHDDVEDL